MDVLLTRRASQLDAALTTGADGLSVQHELSVVHRLHTVAMVTASPPSDEFREALRTRLLAVAAVQGVGLQGANAPEPASAVSWRARAAALSAGVMAGVVAVSGVAVASSRSLPGDPFYGVKRITEDLQLTLADGAQAEGVRHLQFASTRLREVRALVLGRDAAAAVAPVGAVDADEAEGVREALRDMDEQTRTGVRLLTSAFRESRSADPLEELSRFASRQGDGLRAMLPALGPVLAQAQGSLTLLDGVRAEADEMLMLVDCTDECDPARIAPAPAEGGSAGAGSSPCSCPTRVPVPKTAPAPPAPAPAPAPGPAGGGPGAGPSSPPPSSEAPSAPPSQAPAAPPADDEPEPLPVPLPTVPVTPPLPPVGPPGVPLS